MQQVTRNVCVETRFRGCNPGFVTTKDGVVMIDTPQKPSDALHWRQEIAKHGPVRYIFNTEPHIDHWTGNAFFQAPVIAHEGVREGVLSTDPGPFLERLASAAPGEQDLLQGYQFSPPTITFCQGLTLHVGDHTFQAIAMPGHTPYQAAVLVREERVVFTSDNVFHKVQTFLHEALPDLWLKALEDLKGMDVDAFVPGHGEVFTDRAYLDEQAAFIREWVALVRDAIAAGVSKEEAMEKLSLLDRYPMDVGIEHWGPTVMRWNVAHLYDVLMREPEGAASSMSSS